MGWSSTKSCKRKLAAAISSGIRFGRSGRGHGARGHPEPRSRAAEDTQHPAIEAFVPGYDA
jgi:hypothetical protein